MKKKALILGAAGLIVLCAIAVGILFAANSAATGDVNERIEKADEFAAAGRIKKAENTYKSVLLETSFDIDTSKKLVNLYKENGDYKKMEKLLRELMARYRDDFSVYEMLLGIYREKGDVTAAFSFIDSINDEDIRRKCLDMVYDRNSEFSLIMGNTPGNYTNGAPLAFWQDEVFYSDSSDKGRLYKYSNGKNIKLSDDRVQNLSVVGDYLYFVDISKNSRIFKMKTDGSELEQIGDIPVSSLMIIAGKFYFINMETNELCTMELNGKNLKSLSDKKIMNMYNYGSNFYTDNPGDMETTLRISLDGKQEELYIYHSCYFVTGYDDMLYFKDNTDANVWGASTSGDYYQNVHESMSGYINASGGYVYFVDVEDNGTIIKMDLLGTEKTKLVSDNAAWLSIDGDYIYYFNGNDGEKLYRIKNDGTERTRLN